MDGETVACASTVPSGTCRDFTGIVSGRLLGQNRRKMRDASGSGKRRRTGPEMLADLAGTLTAFLQTKNPAGKAGFFVRNLVAGGRTNRYSRKDLGGFFPTQELAEIVRQAKVLCIHTGHTGLYNADA